MRLASLIGWTVPQWRRGNAAEGGRGFRPNSSSTPSHPASTHRKEPTGCDPYVTKLVTHARPKDVFDLYTTVPWERRYAETAKLRTERR